MAIAHTRRDSFKLGLMSLADQSPCTSWLAQYERTEACRAALALNVSGWPASRSAMAPRLTPSIKQTAQQSRVSLRTRDDMPRPVAFGLTRPSCARQRRTVYRVRDIPARSNLTRRTTKVNMPARNLKSQVESATCARARERSPINEV